MDTARARKLGLVGGGGALVVALGVATFGGPEVVAPPPAPPAATVRAAPSVAESVPIPPVETAMAGPEQRPISIPQSPQKALVKDAPAANPNLEFIVRFDTRHPLSRAQDLYLQGKRTEAEALVGEILPRRSELAGLCFSRFTLGAEIVFAHCARVPSAQVQRTSDRWERKLKGMRGVQYADANVILTPEVR
jgi:hypothetical protein